MHRIPTGCGVAVLALALLAGCERGDGPTSVDDDPTPTSPSSGPLPTVDSAPGGGAGGPSAGDPLGTGEP